MSGDTIACPLSDERLRTLAEEAGYDPCDGDFQVLAVLLRRVAHEAVAADLEAEAAHYDSDRWMRGLYNDLMHRAGAHRIAAKGAPDDRR
jgi:hypothetical protein